MRTVAQRRHRRRMVVLIFALIVLALLLVVGVYFLGMAWQQGGVPYDEFTPPVTNAVG